MSHEAFSRTESLGDQHRRDEHREGDELGDGGDVDPQQQGAQRQGGGDGPDVDTSDSATSTAGGPRRALDQSSSTVEPSGRQSTLSR